MYFQEGATATCCARMALTLSVDRVWGRLSPMPGRGGRDARARTLTMQRMLAVAMLAAAVLVIGGAVLLPGVGLAFISVALVLAAATLWRISSRIAREFQESNAWSEAAQLRSLLVQRDALWSDLPAPSAAWDSQGQLLLASIAWQRLGLRTDAPPNELELSFDNPPRVFVVEQSSQPSGIRLVLLREVTRERQALQAKDELLAVVGHELRTPLTAIKGYGQLMARQLATVQEQVQRLDGLIGDVLDTARAEGGRLALRREPLSLSDLVDFACERFSVSHPTRTLEKKLDARALIEADPGRLNQVMDNLLSNAAKYSPPDTVITVNTFSQGDWVRVAVTDRGLGIKREHLARLFDRFYRVPVEDGSAPPGFGLGLSIVRDLVEAHGGRVEVASNGPGTGCTFSVALPVMLPIDDQPAPAPAVTSN
jgi:signal transduction histidine kinase